MKRRTTILLLERNEWRKMDVDERCWWNEGREEYALSSRDPLRLIYSEGMMRHCVMLNAAFMTRSWSSHADFDRASLISWVASSLTCFRPSVEIVPAREIQLRHFSIGRPISSHRNRWRLRTQSSRRTIFFREIVILQFVWRWRMLFTQISYFNHIVFLQLIIIYCYYVKYNYQRNRPK